MALSLLGQADHAAAICGLRSGAAARSGRRARLSSFLAVGLAAAGVGLLPWMIYLAVSLPVHTTAWHWPAAWIGLDALKAGGLIGTGVLLLRRDARYCLIAMATAGVLLADAWFDVATAAPGADALSSLLMAMFAEVPAAALCIGLAVTGLRRSSGPAARRRCAAPGTRG